MAKSILIQNAITVNLVNQLAKLVGKTPGNTADWYLQQALRKELKEQASGTNNSCSKTNNEFEQPPSVGG